MKSILTLGFAVLFLASCAGTGSEPSSTLLQLNQAAESGDADSQYQLGLRYTNGSGVEQDYAIAAEWLVKASEQGHDGAEFLLGVAYVAGRGVEQNQEEAIRLFTDAANDGHARAQYQLGEAFANARGTEKNLLWAARWYEKAARQKHSEAAFSLGVMRASGIDAEPDQEQAWSWLHLAAEGGHALAAKVRDHVATSMTASQLSNAKARMENWQWPTTSPYDDPPTIRYVQRGLNTLGIPAGKDDGIAGSATNAAIVMFRESQGLGSAAVIDTELVSRIRKELSGQK